MHLPCKEPSPWKIFKADGVEENILPLAFLHDFTVPKTCWGKVNMLPLALKLLTLTVLIFFQFCYELLKSW